MSAQDTNKLAEQNNQQIRDAILGHLFPLEAGPQSLTTHDVICELHSEDEAERPAANLGRGQLQKPL